MKLEIAVSLIICTILQLVQLSKSKIMRKSFAIIGGGMSGLSTAFNILKLSPNAQITIIDPTKQPEDRSLLENTASVVAAGLLHPFTPKGGISWKGFECFDETLRSIKMIEKSLGLSLYIDNYKIIRPCMNQNHVDNMQALANKYPDHCSFFSYNDSKEKFGSIVLDNWLGTALFKTSTVLDSPLYLSLLWKTIKTWQPKSLWVSEELTSEQELIDIAKTYDAVVLACGYKIKDLMGETIGPLKAELTFVRGQNLIIDENDITRTTSQSDDLKSLSHDGNSYALLCGEYKVPNGQFKTIIGATHEYSPSLLSAPADLTVAQNLLQDKLIKICKPPQKFDYAVAGVRVNSKRSHEGKLPLIGRLQDNIYLITAMGSRGLLYHSYASKLLANFVLDDDYAKEIPLEILYI